MYHDNDARTTKPDARNSSACWVGPIFCRSWTKLTALEQERLQFAKPLIRSTISCFVPDIFTIKVEVVRNCARILLFWGRGRHFFFGGGALQISYPILYIRVAVEHVSKFGDDRRLSVEKRKKERRKTPAALASLTRGYSEL